MAIDKELNIILKEMWRLDDKLKAGESFVIDESLFYALHIRTITAYYESNARYWKMKSKLPASQIFG